MSGPIPLILAFMAIALVAANAVMGVVVAPVLFHELPDRTTAGYLFGNMLLRYEAILLAGGFTIAAGCAVMAFRGRYSWTWLRALSVALGLILGVSLWLMHTSSYQVHQMRSAKAQAPADDPIHSQFDTAHKSSEQWYKLTTLLLLASVPLAVLSHHCAVRQAARDDGPT